MLSKLWIFLFFLLFYCCLLESNKRVNSDLKFGGVDQAIEFPKNLDWINTKRKVTIKELKGKIVILHFWKYSSINSIHSLQDLKNLETKWRNELVVIGIHSPKFPTEKKIENLRQAVLRLEIKHPVISDVDFNLWRLYSINSWPSFVLIDPNGMVVGVQSGEGIQEGFDKFITGMVTEFNNLSLMNLKPIDFLIEEKENIPTNILSYPGKLILNETNNELFISDTNHNRILRVDIKTKKILDIIGNGKKGFRDGIFYEATFYHPQGLALKDEMLYIADSENHSIREANLQTKKVRTLAGTGKQATTFNVSGIGRNVSINSPWDLIEYRNKLYITMRGAHQIWTLDLKTLEADAYAGLGSENLFDGKLEEASFAQPTAITKDEVRFFVADSETSAIRSLDFKSSKLIKTIIGKGLFEFGDLDNSYPLARLQYPIGISYSNGNLFVADSFNNKIKLIHPYEKKSITLAGNGNIGAVNGNLLESSFFEPSGLAVSKNKIYVADTNNHLIRVIDLDTQTVSNFEIEK